MQNFYSHVNYTKKNYNRENYMNNFAMNVSSTVWAIKWFGSMWLGESYERIWDMLAGVLFWLDFY